MKSTIACLFVLVLATQFQFYKCGLSAVYGGNVVNDGFSEVHVTNTVPVANPVAQARDELGQASFGYAHPGQAATNLRDGFGNQIGSYAYINPEGKEVRVSYTADSRGFRVLSNDLRVAPVANYLVVPFQVEDTPEDTQPDEAFPSVVSAPDVPDSYGKAAYEDFMENIDKESSYWVSPEGEKFSLTSATDEEEFKPKGAHLPVAPVHVYELPVAPVHEYELPVAPALP